MAIAVTYTAAGTIAGAQVKQFELDLSPLCIVSAGAGGVAAVSRDLSTV